MESSKAIVGVSSPSESLALPSGSESQLSSLVYDMSQQVQEAMENMLKNIAEVDQSSFGITDEIEKSKESAIERKKSLEEEKERFQKAAFSVLNMFNGRDFS